MSLTRLLNAPDVRKRFDAELEKPRVALRSRTFAAPANPGRAALVGAAFDYVLRLHVVIHNENYWADEWAAERALERLEEAFAAGRPVCAGAAGRSAADVLDRARRVVADARAEFERCYEARNVSDEMLRASLRLARLDRFHHGGRLVPSFDRIDSGDVDDLRRLLAVARDLPEKPFAAGRVCVLHPTFREASRMVGGAEADLLIDDTLIDVDTASALAFTPEIFRRLVGYYVLYTIGGGITRRVRPKPQIRNVGVYFARFGTLLTVPIDSVVRAETFPDFVRWFKLRASGGPAALTRIAAPSRGSRATHAAPGSPPPPMPRPRRTRGSAETAPP